MEYNIEDFKNNPRSTTKPTGRPSSTNTAINVIAKKVDPIAKIKFGVMIVLTIVFVILAIILIPTGISTTISGKFASGLSSLAIGGLLGYAAFWMIEKMI